MQAYRTQSDLIAGRVLDLHTSGRMDKTTAEIHAADELVYVPHIYRGGWVIRGFGYSTERIGQYVAADNAGYPEVV
jgi:hypothetical protein